jgi:hypothetical protein
MQFDWGSAPASGAVWRALAPDTKAVHPPINRCVPLVPSLADEASDGTPTCRCRGAPLFHLNRSG